MAGRRGAGDAPNHGGSFELPETSLGWEDRDGRPPHQTRHFVYVPGFKGAQQLARRLKTPDRLIEVDTSARVGYWLVVVRQSIVVTPEAMASLRAEFESAAAPLGGAYDRWQVDLQGS